MTAREIMIKLGFELDRSSESRVEAGVQSLRDNTSQLLSGLSVGFDQSGISDMVRDFGVVSDRISEAVSETDSLQSAQEDLLDVTEELGESYRDVVDAVDELSDVSETIDDLVEQGDLLIENNENIIDSLEEVREGYEDLEDSIENTIDLNGDLEDSVDDVRRACDDLSDSFPDEIAVRFELDEQSQALAQAGIEKLHNFATGLLGAISVGFSMVNMAALMEEFGTVNQQIKNSVDGLVDVDQAQDAILQSANQVRMSYEDTAKAVSTLVSSSPDLFSLEEAVAYNEATTKLFKASGKSNEEVASLMESINQSFQKGYVDSGTIGTLLENSPSSIQLLNERLGTTSDQLEALADEGLISIQDLKYAFLDNADAIDESFADVRFNITDALTHIRNSWGFWLADLDETYGITEAIGTAMVKAFTFGMNILDQIKNRVVWFIEKLGGVENALKLIGIIGASVLGVVLLPKILAVISAIKTMDKALLLAKLKMIGMVAVVVLLALLIEDFICFMKGEDSVIGSLFEKAGIDAEKARETILNAWNTIKNFLATTWDFLKSIAQTVLQAIATWWVENGEFILAQMKRIWDAVLLLCITLWNALKQAAILIFEALKTFWDYWGETIIQMFKILWDTLIALIQPFVDALVALITFFTSVFTGDWEGAWDAILAIAEAIWNMIITVISGAWDIVVALCGKGAQLVTDTFTALHSGLKSIVSAIKDTIIAGFQTAINWILQLPSQAYTWGKDIILGIVAGIQGSISTLISGCKNIASTIRSYIGFSVPETGPLSDADTYMPDMMDLMEEGIHNTKYRVLDAVSELASDMSHEVNGEMEPPTIPLPDEESSKGGFRSHLQNMMDMANLHKDDILDVVGQFETFVSATSQAETASKGTQSLAEYGNQSSTNVTQNVTITNEFHGDTAGQEKSASAMEKATHDMTGELARALSVT